LIGLRAAHYDGIISLTLALDHAGLAPQPVRRGIQALFELGFLLVGASAPWIIPRPDGRSP
jgi:hypothetical protein